MKTVYFEFLRIEKEIEKVLKSKILNPHPFYRQCGLR